MIGTTTSSEYRKYIEGTSLSRDVFTNQIAEHAILITQEILQDLREIYEKHHWVILTKEVIIGATSLATQYIADQFLRGKAIDLIDTQLVKRLLWF